MFHHYIWPSACIRQRRGYALQRMLALGAYLLVSVAAASPVAPVHAAEKLASTYDEAFCDPADGGECADEPTLSEEAPPTPAILDCESPLIADMIGSCDMPKPTWPQLHVPTLRNGNGTAIVVDSGGHDHLSIVSTASSVDGALPLRISWLGALAPAHAAFAVSNDASPDAPHSRLDRPPRA
jgi:hypothetical protein